MINYLGGLYRELHHVKVFNDDEGSYEPTLVILDHNKKGRSFMIPIGSIWKYIEPKHYGDDDKAIIEDRAQFNIIANRAKLRMMGLSDSGLVVPVNTREAKQDVVACGFAVIFNRGTGIYLCTAYNLAKCLLMFDITLCAQSAAQLLLWIQTRLDDLKNMAEITEKEKKHCAGGMSLFVGGNKVGEKDVMLTETDLLIEEHNAN